MMRGRSVEASRVSVISDVHLRTLGSGVSGTARGTYVAADSIAELVHRLLAESDFVVIAGDLFDLDRGNEPLNHAFKLSSLRSLNESHSLWEALSHRRVILLTGNHDPVVADQLGAYHCVNVSGGGLRLRIEHGERFDAPVKRVRPFTSLVTWASGVARHRARKLYDALRWAERVTGGSGEGNDRIADRVTQWLAAHPSYDGFVYGHTHQARFCTGPEGFVLNSGQAEVYPIDVLHIDLIEMRARLVAYTSDTAHPVEGLDLAEADSTALPSPSPWRVMAAELGVLIPLRGSK